MHYQSRTGKEINATEWGILYRQENYAIVGRKRTKKSQVQASWIGVLCDVERDPKLFFLEAWNYEKDTDGKDIKSEYISAWYATEPQVMTAFNLVCGSIERVGAIVSKEDLNALRR